MSSYGLFNYFNTKEEKEELKLGYFLVGKGGGATLLKINKEGKLIYNKSKVLGNPIMQFDVKFQKIYMAGVFPNSVLFINPNIMDDTSDYNINHGASFYQKLDKCYTGEPDGDMILQFCSSEQKKIKDLYPKTSYSTWYDNEFSTIPLSPETILKTKSYYVTTNDVSCPINKTRLKVTVYIYNTPKDVEVKDFTFCSVLGKKLKDLDIKSNFELEFFDENKKRISVYDEIKPNTKYYVRGVNEDFTREHIRCEGKMTEFYVFDTSEPPKVVSSPIFCEIDLPTISDIEVQGNNLKWYDAKGNVLSETTLLVDSVKYFVTQQTNGCESAKAEVLVKINTVSAPSTIAIQEFCEEQKATVKNLYAEGQNIKWYDHANTTLSQDQLLKDGEVYYVSQMIDGCESTKKSEVLVRLTKDALKANDYSDSKCNIELQSLNVNLDDYREKLISNFNSYNFEYFDNGFNKINSINALNIGINQFNVKISNSSGCFTYVQLTIHFFELPKINLPSEIKICKDEVVELDAGVGFSSYEWNTGENSQKIFVNKSGRYDLKVTNSNGCVALHQINIVENNVGEISAIKIENNSAEIAMSTSGDYLYTIDPVGVVWQDSNVFKNLKNGNHRLKVKTKEGCYVDERVFTIFSIVDSFSPNGDGINDYWEISGLENYTGTKINVVDRFGKNVINVVSNGQFKWDGKLNGRPLPTGVYWYVISISDGRVFTGSLTLKNRN